MPRIGLEHPVPNSHEIYDLLSFALTVIDASNLPAGTPARELETKINREFSANCIDIRCTVFDYPDRPSFPYGFQFIFAGSDV